MMTIGGIQYNSFIYACYVFDLLDDDDGNEYVDGIGEASRCQSAYYLRNLFKTLLLSYSLSSPKFAWEESCHNLSTEILYRQCSIYIMKVLYCLIILLYNNKD